MTDARQEAMETFNHLFVRFRMPLFFFISGFVFYKHDRVWDKATAKGLVKTKFMVRIIPTAVFFLLFCFVNECDCLEHLGYAKLGCWFTLALFEFFVFYCLSALFTKGAKNDSEPRRRVLHLVAPRLVGCRGVLGREQHYPSFAFLGPLRVRR